MIKIFGIKNCDTMKKAMAWLAENGVAYHFVDYKNAGIAEACLPDWSARVGWEPLLNKRGQTWRKLSEVERAGVESPTPAVNAENALKLMAQYPSLIKRPVLDTGDHLLVGFSAQSYAAVLQ